MKEPVMERNMSQLREGSLSLNLGSPGVMMRWLFLHAGDGCTIQYVPIIRKAGFSIGLGPGEGKAFFVASAFPDIGFSAMF